VSTVSEGQVNHVRTVVDLISLYLAVASCYGYLRVSLLPCLSFSHLSQVSEIELFHINLFLCFRKPITDTKALQFRVRNKIVTESECVNTTQVNNYGNVKENTLFAVKYGTLVSKLNEKMHYVTVLNRRLITLYTEPHIREINTA
jgi:hypothetical protein